MTHLYYLLLDRHLSPLEAMLCWTKDAGSEAIAKIEGGYLPDFALLDVRINGVNGADVCKKLWEKKAGLPVVFLTAADEDSRDYAEAAKLVGFANVIRKERVRFFEDLLPKIPNIDSYMKCGVECLKAIEGGCSVCIRTVENDKS